MLVKYAYNSICNYHCSHNKNNHKEAISDNGITTIVLDTVRNIQIIDSKNNNDVLSMVIIMIKPPTVFIETTTTKSTNVENQGFNYLFI